MRNPTHLTLRHYSVPTKPIRRPPRSVKAEPHLGLEYSKFPRPVPSSDPRWRYTGRDDPQRFTRRHMGWRRFHTNSPNLSTQQQTPKTWHKLLDHFLSPLLDILLPQD